jgi:hypothetical protein
MVATTTANTVQSTGLPTDSKARLVAPPQGKTGGAGGRGAARAFRQVSTDGASDVITALNLAGSSANISCEDSSNQTSFFEGVTSAS